MSDFVVKIDKKKWIIDQSFKAELIKWLDLLTTKPTKDWRIGSRK